MITQHVSQQKLLMRVASRKTQKFFVFAVIVCVVWIIVVELSLTASIREAPDAAGDFMLCRFHVMGAGVLVTGLCLQMLSIGRALAAFGLDKPENYKTLGEVSNPGQNT